MNDARVESAQLRRRIADDRAEAARLREAVPTGSACLLARTVAVTSYPTAAGVAYGVVAVEADCDEAEGAVPTFSDGPDTFFAVNVGTAVPPVGTVVLIERAGNLWTFQYDG